MQTTDQVPLSWAHSDIEQRVGFRGGRFTQTNTFLTLTLAIASTVALYGVLAIPPLNESNINRILTTNTWTQYATVFLAFWSLFILLVKWRKLALQRKALRYNVVPAEHDFVLSSATVDQVTRKIYATVDDPRQFMLFNRIIIALSNLRNLGQVTDVDGILNSQAEQDQAGIETSYSLVHGFIWAIPILGFIGTVLGLSSAIGGFTTVLGSATEMSQVTGELKKVTKNLGTAFETTLLALNSALLIQLLLTWLKKSEEEFLDHCAEYCLKNVVSRLRILPYEQAEV
jgi:hypothetical protein